MVLQLAVPELKAASGSTDPLPFRHRTPKQEVIDLPGRQADFRHMTLKPAMIKPRIQPSAHQRCNTAQQGPCECDERGQAKPACCQATEPTD